MENNILSYRDRLSRNDSNNYSRDGKPLLDGRANGDGRGLRRIPLQWDVPRTITSRRSAPLVVEGGETDPDNGRKVQAERRPHMITGLISGDIPTTGEIIRG